MIQLPDNWRHMVQVRETNKDRELGLLVLTFSNDAGQLYGFELPVVAPGYMSTQLHGGDKKLFYELAYNTLIEQMPDQAFRQQNVFGRDNGTDTLEVQNIRDQDWQPLYDAGNMIGYDEFMENLS